ncbi:MAG: 50S ribosomal protein L21e [Nanoarchaeota archaeon]|nr:50S ribosomal protein L21e [Nanoarchaeota archaeon]
MVVKSHGKHRRTRDKLRKNTRITVNQYLKKFNIGDRVAIVIESASMESMPCKRFQGLTGKVIGERGRAYFIEINDCGKPKKVLTMPEHLKVIK